MQATLRGFLYQDSQGKWVLDESPNLQSCCVNSSGKQNEQVLLEGDLKPTSHVVNVAGTLQVREGRLLLKNARVESLSYDWVGWVLVFAACGGLLAMWMGRKNNMIKRPP